VIGLRYFVWSILIFSGIAHADPGRFLLPPSELFPEGSSRISVVEKYLRTASRGQVFDSPRVYCREVTEGSDAFKRYHRAARAMFNALIDEVGRQEEASGLYRVLFEYDDYIVAQTVAEMRTSRFRYQTTDEIAEFMYARISDVYSRVYSQHELYERAKRRTSLAVWSSLVLLTEAFSIASLNSIPGTNFKFVAHSLIYETTFLLFLRVLWLQRVIPIVPERVESIIADLVLPSHLQDPIVLRELKFDRQMDLPFDRWLRKLMATLFEDLSLEERTKIKLKLRHFLEPFQSTPPVRNFRKVVEFALAHDKMFEVQAVLLEVVEFASRRDSGNPLLMKHFLRRKSERLISIVRTE
jgi:hypothetical protein